MVTGFAKSIGKVKNILQIYTGVLRVKWWVLMSTAVSDFGKYFFLFAVFNFYSVASEMKFFST